MSRFGAKMGDMRWAARILSFVFAMTAAFVGTVGQAGLTSVDQNLCELARAWIPFVFKDSQQCSAHSWFYYFWLVGGILSVIFLAFDACKWCVRRRLGRASDHGGKERGQTDELLSARRLHVRDVIGGYTPAQRTALRKLSVTYNPEGISGEDWSQFHRDGLVEAGTDGHWQTRGEIKKDLVDIVNAILEEHGKK